MLKTDACTTVKSKVIVSWPHKKLSPICMQKALAFSTNMMILKEIQNVLNKEFLPLCQWFIESKLSIYF